MTHALVQGAPCAGNEEGLVVTIFSDGTISVGETVTGYCVRQTSAGTRVLAWHNNARPRPRDLGAEVMLPRRRYTLSSPCGLAQFETDFLRAWGAE